MKRKPWSLRALKTLRAVSASAGVKPELLFNETSDSDREEGLMCVSVTFTKRLMLVLALLLD